MLNKRILNKIQNFFIGEKESKILFLNYSSMVVVIEKLGLFNLFYQNLVYQNLIS